MSRLMKRLLILSCLLFTSVSKVSADEKTSDVTNKQNGFEVIEMFYTLTELLNSHEGQEVSGELAEQIHSLSERIAESRMETWPAGKADQFFAIEGAMTGNGAANADMAVAVGDCKCYLRTILLVVQDGEVGVVNKKYAPKDISPYKKPGAVEGFLGRQITRAEGTGATVKVGVTILFCNCFGVDIPVNWAVKAPNG